MYCHNCKISVESESGFCPVCGRRLSKSEFYAGSIGDDSIYEESISLARGNSQKRKEVRFNFSKPLCLLFAALLIASMLMPFALASVSVGGTALLSEKPLTIIELHDTSADCAGRTLESLKNGFSEAERAQRLALVKSISIAVTAYFGVCAAFLTLFGLTGLVSKGKLRYFFGRIGGTMYFIGLLALIAAIISSRFLLPQRVAAVSERSGEVLAASVKPTAWLFVSAAAALLFRLLGIRLIRYLNGISCLNKGDYKTAEREFTIIRCFDKVPHTFGRAKLRRGVKYGSREDDSRSGGYDDGVL